jgi:hypothetical protein
MLEFTGHKSVMQNPDWTLDGIEFLGMPDQLGEHHCTQKYVSLCCSTSIAAACHIDKTL